MSSSSEDYRGSDSYLETVRTAARARPSTTSDPALASCSVESTVVLPGSLELRAARPEEANLGNTGEGLVMSIPMPSPQRDTVRIPRGARAPKPRISFHVALMIAMIGATIGVLSGQAMPTGVRAAATAASHARTEAATPASRPTAEPRVATTEKNALDGAVRGKAVRPRAMAMPMTMTVARRPAATSSSGGPSAADIDESMATLAEAQLARPF